MSIFNCVKINVLTYMFLFFSIDSNVEAYVDYSDYVVYKNVLDTPETSPPFIYSNKELVILLGVVLSLLIIGVMVFLTPNAHIFSTGLTFIIMFFCFYNTIFSQLFINQYYSKGTFYLNNYTISDINCSQYTSQSCSNYEYIGDLSCNNAINTYTYTYIHNASCGNGYYCFNTMDVCLEKSYISGYCIENVKICQGFVVNRKCLVTYDTCVNIIMNFYLEYNNKLYYNVTYDIRCLKSNNTCFDYYKNLYDGKNIYFAEWNPEYQTNDISFTSHDIFLLTITISFLLIAIIIHIVIMVNKYYRIVYNYICMSYKNIIYSINILLS